MPNEEIITALRNAVEHGDSLQNAVQIMINSGYDFQEVQEASKYVGEGALLKTQQSEEELVMPGTEKKKLFSKFLRKEKTVLQQTQKPQAEKQEFQATPEYFPPKPLQKPLFQTKPLQQPRQKPQSLAQELKKIQPLRKSYNKEIMLLTILIILVGVLITTIIYRDEILKFFSG